MSPFDRYVHLHQVRTNSDRYSPPNDHKASFTNKVNPLYFDKNLIYAPLEEFNS